MSDSFAAGLVGVVLDERYRLDALLGEGGMGAVYRAHHLQMDRRVAIKLLKPHLTSDDAQVQRFMREARATMKVDSEHAVKVLDFGITPQRDYYMALEYLDGRTVQRELDVDGPFAPARVIHIAKQSLHALGAAHAAGLIHRDIKPDNILLMRVGNDLDYAKVLDFGVAKLLAGTARSDRSAMAITQAGMVFGTPEYMSPEQACGQELDGRSDLYSLAATMFAMLTGCGMYNAKTAIEWLTHHARTPPPHLADGSKELAAYPALDKVMQRCLAKRREERPQTAAEMIALLDSVAPMLGAAKSAASSSARGLAMRAAQSSYFEAIDPNATLAPGAAASVGGIAATPESPYAKTMMPGSMQRPAISDAYAHTMMSGSMSRVSTTPGTSLPAMPSTTTGVIAEVR
ncbi:MAG TPA: serine/threonine-protein kinase, partial [Kofleriaceae bacterium]|nr:serine/threonine-protein kinase [Kofleriaceae bacterium]